MDMLKRRPSPRRQSNLRQRLAGLASALRRSTRWTQVSAKLVGESKARSLQSMAKTAARLGTKNVGAGYGGHFRAVQGFRYLGAAPCA